MPITCLHKCPKASPQISTARTRWKSREARDGKTWSPIASSPSSPSSASTTSPPPSLSSAGPGLKLPPILTAVDFSTSATWTSNPRIRSPRDSPPNTPSPDSPSPASSSSPWPAAAAPLSSSASPRSSLLQWRCPALKVLGLPRISVDDEAQFLNFITNWKDFELLEMESKPSKLAEMVKQIALHCKNFHGLKLRGWIGMEDALGIADSLPKLRFLDLSGSHLSKVELMVILDGCRELKKFKVKDCVGLEGDDEEVNGRATSMDVFEGDSLYRDDEIDDLDLKFMYYDCCFEMWLF